MQTQVVAEFATTEPINSVNISGKYSTNQVSMLTYSDGQVGFFKPGISGLKEVLAYKIGQILGLTTGNNALLSETVLRSYKNYGSVIKKVPGNINFEHDLMDYSEHKNFYEMMIFDFLIANEDRNSENFSVDYQNGSIHALDHSEAFDYRSHVYTFNMILDNWSFEEARIPETIKIALHQNSNEMFSRILNETLFHEDVLKMQNFRHMADGDKPFPAGTFNTIKHFSNLLNLVRESDTFGQFRDNYIQKYGVSA